MTAPTYSSTGGFTTDTGGAWSATSANSPGIGTFIVVHVVQDGTADGTVSITSVTNAENLAGTDNVLTSLGAFDIGASQEAIHHVWLGRMTVAGSAMVITGANSGTDDIYVVIHFFLDVSTGGTIGTVIENSTAGSTTVSNGTSATASDATVTTLGVDRLAVNLLGINDDNSFVDFTGESGGTWVLRSSYAESGGTDGACYLVTAAMPTAGTIDGGTGSITDSDAWGVVGFALIGTTPDAARVPYSTPYPQLLAH